MKPFFEETVTLNRALLSNAREVLSLGDEAETISTEWYNEELPMDELFKKAKEKGKDVITVESQTIITRSYEVK